MIEYDLPLYKKCSNCNGYGCLIYDRGKNSPWEERFCRFCNGTGKVPIGKELEIEKEEH